MSVAAAAEGVNARLQKAQVVEKVLVPYQNIPATKHSIFD
jgi:hypothetical protein